MVGNTYICLGEGVFTDFSAKLKCLKEKNKTFWYISFTHPIQLYFLFNFQKIFHWCMVISFYSMSIPAILIFFILFLYTHISIHAPPYIHTHTHSTFFGPNLTHSSRFTSIFSFSSLLLAGFPVHSNSNCSPPSQDI